MKPLCLALALLCGSAHADFKDGNKLLADMNDNSYVSTGIVLGYVMGIVDAFGGTTHCAPETVTAGQVRDMVKKYLDNNPSVRHLPAALIVGHVLKSAWPCQQRGGGKPL
jgi:hypothetical protein